MVLVLLLLVLILMLMAVLVLLSVPVPTLSVTRCVWLVKVLCLVGDTAVRWVCSIALRVLPMALPVPRASLWPRLPFRLIASLFPPMSALMNLAAPLVLKVMVFMFVRNVAWVVLVTLPVTLVTARLLYRCVVVCSCRFLRI